jgi:DNA mismatch repair protein MSH6
LTALDEAEAKIHSKQKVAVAPKPKPAPIPSTKPKTASSMPWSSSARPSSSTLTKTASSSKKPSSDDLPYDFLTNPLDANRNPPGHPDFDPRTLYIPERTLKTLTAFEKQYWEIKRKNNDCVLFFQKGKFYELYEDDALIAHREFGLKLTDRVKMKMAGVPESSYTMFANKFLALGYKVGRVDQTETAVGKDMRKANGTKSKASSVAGSEDNNTKIVRRDLRSIMTAGTIVDSECLQDDMPSYCISIKEVVHDDATSGQSASGLTGGDDEESMRAKITFGVCILDAGVAKFDLHQIDDDVTRTKFETMLRSLRIKEVLYEKGHLSKRSLRIIRNTVDPSCNITMLKPGVEFLDKDSTLRKLNLVFNKDLADCDSDDIESIEPVDVSLLPPAIAECLDKEECMSALGGMLSYLTQLNLEKDMCASKKFDIFDRLAQNECMILDAQSLTHLNVLLNEQGNTQGTLLQLVNRAVTPFGKRLMKVWLLSPLARIEAIRDRQNAVEEILRDSSLADDFDSFTKSLPDIERIMPRIYAGNCKSKDFAKVLRALSRIDGHVEEWKGQASGYDSRVVSQLLDTMPSVSSQAKAIQSKYQDESFEPKRGSDEDYDEADQAVITVEKDLDRELAEAAQQVKLSREKVKFKDVGTNEIYQIEVPIKTKVPDDWSLTSQTQSVKRYYPPSVRVLVKELKEARETRVAALKAFQSKLFQMFQKHGEQFLQVVKGLAELDCLISLAKASRAMNEPTCRPEFVDSETAVIEFKDLRHPCLANSTSADFIANDITLGGETEEDPTVTILTGGNMAGKSTTARTTATGVILAQLGCRVPAMEARLSPIDRIATRMGANDQIFRNNSTFMVEMLEASRILKDGSPRSLVIMDELGRGTSTFGE